MSMNIPIDIARKGLTEQYIVLRESLERAIVNLDTAVDSYNGLIEQMARLVSEHVRSGEMYSAYLPQQADYVKYGSYLNGGPHTTTAWTHAQLIAGISGRITETAGLVAEARTKLDEAKSKMGALGNGED